MKYEKLKNGERLIYRTYNDTEVVEIAVNVQCPYCEYEWQEDKTDCGTTYDLICGGELRDILNEGCGKKFKMYFNAS